MSRDLQKNRASRLHDFSPECCVLKDSKLTADANGVHGFGLDAFWLAKKNN